MLIQFIICFTFQAKLFFNLGIMEFTNILKR